jgi:GWxTD domain-containing protein
MSGDRRSLSLLVLSVMLGLLAAPGLARAQFPTDPAEAMRYVEQETEIGDWADGPVQYLMTREEDDIWKGLRNDDERRDFVAWFWDRRDDDLRDRSNPFKEGFYTRVAGANERFAGFPRGWRSDRGHVWVVLGRPDSIRPGGLSSESWTYNTYGGILKSSSYMGEMQVVFNRVDTAKWEIAGGIGPGAWPNYVLRAFDIVNQAVIVNPDLEWK